jgi:hypothetical protein
MTPRGGADQLFQCPTTAVIPVLVTGIHSGDRFATQMDADKPQAWIPAQGRDDA